MTVDISDRQATPDPSCAELIATRPPLAMHAMDGLALDGVALNAIADALGTPTWVYSAATMRARLGELTSALKGAGLNAQIRYALKANDHLAVLRVFALAGAGADVVSEGEFLRAREAGIPTSQIVFSGVGKLAAELRLAVTEEIGQVNVESAEELHTLSTIAAGLGRTVRVALRVNPDVDAGTHSKITTGRAGDKFGIPYRQVAALYATAATLPGLRPVGLAVHIGSQVQSLTPYRAAFARLSELARELRAAGYAVSTVDCGGGLGIGYRNEPTVSPAALAGALRAAFHGLDVELIVELGRWLVGPAGVLLASVILEKQQEGTRIVVLDAGMNDLVRPAMYDAWHGVAPVSPVDTVAEATPADIVGPVCESGDTFARNRLLPPLAAGARVAILDTGAYGAVMSSTYNARPLAAVAMVDGERWSVIRDRQPCAALWRDELVPEWLV
jgi:diaminopimelate decarboxylase